MYGIAVAALGMLSIIATGLAIDAYGPVNDNAGDIAEMAGMSHIIRERTDAVDAAGNTTATIGKDHRCYCTSSAPSPVSTMSPSQTATTKLFLVFCPQMAASKKELPLGVYPALRHFNRRTRVSQQIL